MGVSKRVEMGKVVLVLCVWVMIWCVGVATAAPASTTECNSQLPHLLPCAGFVQGTDKTPPSDCCKGLSSVVNASPACLCSLLSSGAAGAASINSTLASELPSKCNIKNASPSDCKGSAGPAPAPVAGGRVPGTSPGGSSEGPHPSAAFIPTPFGKTAYLGLITLYLLFFTQ